ncbi:UDP-N-acetylmuramoyl-tripeptide--D-alanyl-D-alanine ligase [Ignavibacterium sp.]|uniref:UDP-N-acetylmuramoyl-tripeptide--D-alanyl-D- alanine ligase n=1 Tax=Ignavibacterium sp. TaxID=2651167 RepID=UPI002202CDDB|nr:UDP-N-acetylmuramoyl-tripeptide--D-alanyl-D-alanine ligase [Ignavibacterium sp.]BDQ02534.1 MAG: UDP-N-acetylmuramoyl-tripeptide--D-alanyl-D-alanine ligase [Ignavibacterium sp.]
MKKIKLTLNDFFNLPDAEIFNPDRFKDITSVSIDSRKIGKNCLFIAIKGERFDGHDFIEEVVKKKVSAVMINKNQLKRFSDLEIPFITVKDTTKSLGDIASVWRDKLNAKVIGITGSAGKTTTKEIIAAILSVRYRVHKTNGNNNNHIGVPLTLLNAKARHQILVVEQGTNHFGEIKYTSKISKPDLALITNIGYSHIEFLKDRNGVLKEKSELLKITVQRGGVAFINNDDDLLRKFGKRLKRKITFGFDNFSDYQAKILIIDKTGRAIISIKYGKKLFQTKLPIAGEQNAKNFLAAFAIAKELGLSDKQILKGLKRIKSVNKRLEIKKFKDTIIINDSYNANPDSMKASLNLLSKMKPSYKKIAVLGDMFELGSQSIKLHKEIGSFINELKLDTVYTLGKFSENIINTLNSRVPVKKHFKEKKNLISSLKRSQLKKTVVLIKGSRGMKMEEIYSALEESLK